MINTELREYIEREILPRYDHFDTAHRRDHAMTVIAAALRLAEHYDVDKNMVYAAAAYHDTGLVAGRAEHHSVSRRIILEDKELQRWFSEAEIAIIADAAEDHRASSKHVPRTIYGRIVAEADRVIDSHTIIRRTIQFTRTHHPELDKEQGYERMVEHLTEKYDYGGYLKLWIEESDNAKRLAELRAIIADKTLLRRLYDKIYLEEITR